MEKPKDNKRLDPSSNKKMVKIKMRPGRAATGVTTDRDGYATVDEHLAEHLVSIQYADLAEEK